VIDQAAGGGRIGVEIRQERGDGAGDAGGAARRSQGPRDHRSPEYARFGSSPLSIVENSATFAVVSSPLLKNGTDS